MQVSTAVVPAAAEAFRRFDATLTTAGIRAALTELLELTDYRYIAIFRFQDGHANAAVYVDRLNPGQLSMVEVPETATYCCYVRDSRGLFATADTLLDDRLAGHPARDIVRAYCGVPVMDAEGVLIGTLCHYDHQPRDPAQIDLELMLQVASRLARGSFVPPYPTRR